MKTRILLVDDHRMFREGLASLVNARPDMETVGDAGDGREALRLAGELSPAVIVLDVGMPEMNGIETVRLLKASHPDVKVIGLSAHREHRIIVEMLRAGAFAYVLKDSPFEELVEAVHCVSRDRVFISPSASAELVMDLVQGVLEERGSAFSVLTSRETEVLQAVAEGKSTKEIALDLSVSVKTVETHRQQLMDKLNIHSVAELTKYAIREDITEV